jgi:hypothetical protein
MLSQVKTVRELVHELSGSGKIVDICLEIGGHSFTCQIVRTDLIRGLAESMANGLDIETRVSVAKTDMFFLKLLPHDRQIEGQPDIGFSCGVKTKNNGG